jgi:hypothetical protein
MSQSPKGRKPFNIDLVRPNTAQASWRPDSRERSGKPLGKAGMREESPSRMRFKVR